MGLSGHRLRYAVLAIVCRWMALAQLLAQPVDWAVGHLGESVSNEVALSPRGALNWLKGWQRGGPRMWLTAA